MAKTGKRSIGAAPPDRKEQRRARRILANLKKEFPDARTELRFDSPFQLLVATILAAQSTDVTVNKVTPGLFRSYPTPEAFARASEETLRKEIRSTGFFRMKARAIIESSQDLVERFRGRLPADMESLTSLRGVGRKTANVVLASAFDRPAIIVDTHVKRCAARLGLTRNTDPDKIEFDLRALLPEKSWSEFSHALVLHGRYICVARKPKCGVCPLASLCPSAAPESTAQDSKRRPSGGRRGGDSPSRKISKPRPRK